MLMPKTQKFRKQHRGRMKGKAYRGCNVDFGDYGLQALQPAWITSRQIEAARVAMTRAAQRGGKVWIRIFPDKPVTKRGQEMPMGKGKGAPEYFVAVSSPDESCSRWPGWSRSWRVRRCGWPPTSSRSRRKF